MCLKEGSSVELDIACYVYLEKGGHATIGNPIPDLYMTIVGTAEKSWVNTNIFGDIFHLAKCFPQFDQLIELMAAVC